MSSVRGSRFKPRERSWVHMHLRGVIRKKGWVNKRGSLLEGLETVTRRVHMVVEVRGEGRLLNQAL